MATGQSYKTGECSYRVASLIIQHVSYHYPEQHQKIRAKFMDYCRLSWKGPGTELKKIFDKILIKKKEGCNCDKHAAAMNRWGCDKCLENIDIIVGWLRDEAKERDLPFSEMGAKALIRLAVRRARKKKDE